MKFKDLYEKGLTRKVNPAVSASDLDSETVKTEIREYVFTEEIIINLYKLLTNIRLNQGSHVGIWINGYYGSGKSHFLKYANYCLTAEHSEEAFDRLIEAATEYLNAPGGMGTLEEEGVTAAGLQDLKNWFSKTADVEMVLFNIGDVDDKNANQATAFTTIFWNQFNKHRGYNSFNLAFAQFFEKALDDDGKFDEFKQYIKDKGYDWERNITRFAAGKLDLALQFAKDVDPDLSYDIIRSRIQNNAINVSVDAFAAELNEYIRQKHNPKFRLLFFVDEVSQFIGEHRDLLLQLQSLVKRLDEVCESKVWIACTAQQRLEEVVQNVGGNLSNPNDEVGKILGRFEVRASLQGTSPEYITQKRILEKTGSAEIDLGEMFDEKRTMMEAQFVLPNTYQSYRSKGEFIATYPFVPYQFDLIMKVLDSFVNMNYVDKQVKGNERSLINITYSIAQATAENEVGDFIPFDRFFGPMFQGSMQHLGQRAMENARRALDLIVDEKKQEFARRVVYVLFMICNLADNDKPTFLATTDNIVTLLMTKIDENKAVIKHSVEQVIDFLMKNAVIRRTKSQEGIEIYEFFSEEESKVAQLINNQQVDSLTYSAELYRIIDDYFALKSDANKVSYGTRSFNVGWNIDTKTEKSNSPDVVVDFFTSVPHDRDTADLYAFSNPNNHLVFFLAPQFAEDKELRSAFLEYCRVQKFAQEPVISDERRRIRELFVARAKQMYAEEIKPKMHHILDTCPLIAGTNVLSSAEMGTLKKTERYRRALIKEMESLYDCAKLVEGAIPKTGAELAISIKQPTNPMLHETPLRPAESKVKLYLDRQTHDVTVAEIVRDFAKVPYGWSDVATIYIINELVRRHLYAYNYMGNPNVTRDEVAAKVVREANRFTVEPAQAIPQDIINAFIDAWKEIFNVVTVNGGNDPAELLRNCKEDASSDLNKLLGNYEVLRQKIDGRPFADDISKAIALMKEWRMIRDPKKFFVTITEAKPDAAALFDRCKTINEFANSQQWRLYTTIIDFIHDGRDNFPFLPNECRETVDKLRGIETEPQPWNTLPSYKKMMAVISNQLSAARQGLIAEIKDKYSKVFDELEKYATEMNVPLSKFANRDSTILMKTSSSSFSTLQLNLDTTKFYQSQMERINEAIPAPPPTPVTPPSHGGDPTPVTPPKPITRIRKVITLNTHTTEPMRNEHDVDLYLAALKSEIMQHINDQNDIIIS